MEIPHQSQLLEETYGPKLEPKAWEGKLVGYSHDSVAYKATGACPATEPPSIAEGAKQAPVSPASSSDNVALQASVDSGSDRCGATDSRESVPHVEAVETCQELKGEQIPTRGASPGATVAPIPSHTGLTATPTDVTISHYFTRAKLAKAAADRTGSYEERDNDRGKKEKGDGSDGSTHAASDPDGSDGSELGATSPEGCSSSTGRKGLLREQLWGRGIAVLGAVVLVAGLSRRRRTG